MQLLFQPTNYTFFQFTASKTITFFADISKMEALAASGEVGGARGAIFKQMAEMKKKIQLVEGERKAIFEDSEREKEENKGKIKKLNEEIKQFKSEVCLIFSLCFYLEKTLKLKYLTNFG